MKNFHFFHVFFMFFYVFVSFLSSNIALTQKNNDFLNDSNLPRNFLHSGVFLKTKKITKTRKNMKNRRSFRYFQRCLMFLKSFVILPIFQSKYWKIRHLTTGGFLQTYTWVKLRFLKRWDLSPPRFFFPIYY